MLYIILLLILAAILFGSSAVIGFLGWVLGLVVVAIALIWAGIAYDLPSEIWVFIGIGSVMALAVAHYAIQAKIRSDEARIGPEAVASYKKLLTATEAKMKARKR